MIRTTSIYSSIVFKQDNSSFGGYFGTREALECYVCASVSQKNPLTIYTIGSLHAFIVASHT